MNKFPGNAENRAHGREVRKENAIHCAMKPLYTLIFIDHWVQSSVLELQNLTGKSLNLSTNKLIPNWGDFRWEVKYRISAKNFSDLLAEKQI